MTLSEILIQNLLKNAFLHNVAHGRVRVQIQGKILTIANTGEERQEPLTTLEKDRLFSRFYKNSSNPDTWGLGLAIARKIAQTSGWKLHYRFQQDMHVFEVNFG